ARVRGGRLHAEGFFKGWAPGLKAWRSGGVRRTAWSGVAIGLAAATPGVDRRLLRGARLPF
ncbi:MAG: hypothetical protein AAF909_05645, partial [Pseudomonadota bacterium]